MDQSRQDLCRLDQARARPIEVGVSVDRKDPARSRCGKLLPAGVAELFDHFGVRTFQVEAARHREQDFGRGTLEIGKFQPWAVRPRLDEVGGTTSDGNQFRHPVSGHHQRVEPLDAGHLGRLQSGWPSTRPVPTW